MSRKLLHSSVFVENLEYHESTNEIGGKFDMHITGRITIDFVSSGDMAKFLTRHPDGKVTINGLSEVIGYKLIDEYIEI